MNTFTKLTSAMLLSFGFSCGNCYATEESKEPMEVETFEGETTHIVWWDGELGMRYGSMGVEACKNGVINEIYVAVNDGDFLAGVPEKVVGKVGALKTKLGNDTVKNENIEFVNIVSYKQISEADIQMMYLRVLASSYPKLIWVTVFGPTDNPKVFTEVGWYGFVGES